MQYWDGHILTCLIKTLVIYLYCAYYACASYLFVWLFVIFASYSLLSFIYFVRCLTIHSFCCLISFLINSLLFRCSLFKRGKTNSDPELYSGISIPSTVQHHQYESINIIQQTPPTLSQYRSKGPIGIHRHCGIHNISTQTNVAEGETVFM